MSDIIPFPKLQQKLYKDIKSSHNSQHYETVYQLIEDYEAQFELDETLALIKCDMFISFEFVFGVKRRSYCTFKKRHSSV